jgi:uncharacterized protein
MAASDERYAADTLRWLERAVIGLNLCPFAKAVHAKRLIHVAVCEAGDAASVLGDLAGELAALAGMPPQLRETTLLVVPHALHDFLEFVDVTARAERLVRKRGWEGVIQVASFHPQYQFEGTAADDITNCTNRSPWPTLHLLREDSITRAVETFPRVESIYEDNVRHMRSLGADGWAALDVGPSR